LDCAIAAEAAKTITDASKADVIFLIATSREHPASLLRGIFVVGAIMPQATRSGKPQAISAKRNDCCGTTLSSPLPAGERSTRIVRCVAGEGLYPRVRMRGETPHPKPALRSGFDLSPPERGEKKRAAVLPSTFSFNRRAVSGCAR
jgi:hypothetical protein